MTDYRKILIFKPGAIGDMLHLTPVIRAIMVRYPSSEITLILSSPITASLFMANPLVKRIIIFDKRGAHRSPAAMYRLWRELKCESYDLILNFQRSNLKGWLLLTAAMPSRVLVYHKAKGRLIHAVVNHLETLTPLGIIPDDVSHHLDFPVGPDANEYAESFFIRHGLINVPVVAFNPGTSTPVRCWPTDRFIQLGDRLISAGIAVVIVGSPAERTLAEEIATRMVHRPVVETDSTLPQLAALLKRCRVLVTGVTGPMHIGSAVGARVIGLFGSLNPLRDGPIGVNHVSIRNISLPCVPCNSLKKCSHTVYRECMNTITVIDVFNAIIAVLDDESQKQIRGEIATI